MKVRDGQTLSGFADTPIPPVTVESKSDGPGIEAAAMQVPRAASQFSLDFCRRFTAESDAARALAETQRAWLTPVPGERAADHARRFMTAWAHVFYVRSSE